jgi:hypothetical protein
MTTKNSAAAQAEATYRGPKAIDTQYRGYLFRSRLEARYAIFLDTLGVTWDYEIEGFKLPSGWYLPDFFIRGNGHYGPYLEVKAIEPTAAEKTKLCELCAAKSAYGVFAWGAPGDERVLLIDKEGDVWSDHDNPTLAEALLEIVPEGIVSRAYATARSARFEHGARK